MAFPSQGQFGSSSSMDGTRSGKGQALSVLLFRAIHDHVYRKPKIRNQFAGCYPSVISDCSLPDGEIAAKLTCCASGGLIRRHKS